MHINLIVVVLKHIKAKLVVAEKRLFKKGVCLQPHSLPTQK